jgi:hypothetical protein
MCGCRSFAMRPILNCPSGILASESAWASDKPTAAPNADHCARARTSASARLRSVMSCDNQRGGCPGKRDRMRCELDVDDLAGLEAVAPAAVGLPGAPRLTELSEERLDILGGPDLFDRHPRNSSRA